jgi:hypothetical protein
MVKREHILKQTFSASLLLVNDNLGNVPIARHTSKLFTVILCIYSAYQQTQQISEPPFNLLFVAVLRISSEGNQLKFN